jgi:hypothetical protein
VAPRELELARTPILQLPIHPQDSSSQISARQLTAAAITNALASNPTSSRNPSAPSVVGVATMHPGRHRHRGGIAADADFVAIGFTLVLSAVSCLLFVLVGSNDTGGEGVQSDMEWEVIPAFGLMSAGLLLIMYGMRARGARPPVLVRRVANAAGAALLHPGGPERLLAVMILLMLPFLEAWFDFF